MVSGSILRDAIISGAYNIANQKKSVDELNVFPVPDGDTGTNMSMTILSAVKPLQMLENPTVSAVADAAASAMLRGARGNSGVILSLLFRGLSQGMKGQSDMDAACLVRALDAGVQAAYKAVMKPTEGTMLTVARLGSEQISRTADQTQDPVALFSQLVAAASDALEQTPQMLPVLKKAGVVDAGGKGLLVIFEGMNQVFAGQGMVEKLEVSESGKLANPAAEFDGEITFTYCTQFLVNRGENRDKDPLALRAYFETIGDSVVVVDDEDIIKVHVHTDNPGKAIQEGLKYGYLTSFIIDNMREQHNEKAYQAAQSKQQAEYAAVDPTVAYGFVAVGAGQGVAELFQDLGVNKVVSGGQTMNPSTEDILEAIHSVPAKQVFVLPNNKNIIMAAEQAMKLADRTVCVLQSRTIPQGISAMMAFDPDAGFEDNQLQMTKAMAQVDTGQVTFAARDSDFDGHNIKQGEILAIENGKLSFTDRDVNHAAYRLIRSMCKRDTQFVTILYGADLDDDTAEQLYNQIAAKLGDSVEVVLINGGQPVYYYIVSVE